MARNRNNIYTPSTDTWPRASGGFRAENSAQARSVGWQIACAPTVKVGGVGSPRYLIYQETVGSLCATDYKWVQQEQVMQGKLIVYETDRDNSRSPNTESK